MTDVPARATGTGADRGSVLLVLLDDVGTEYLDWMEVGASYATSPAFRYAHTPFLSRLARDSVWFQQFYATPLCSPSRARLLTGLRCDQTGIGQNIRAPATPQDARFPRLAHTMNEGQRFLGQAVRALDPTIETAYFGKWHVSDLWDYVPRNSREDYPPTANLHDFARFGFDAYTGGPLPYGGSYEWWKVVDGAPQYVKPPPYDESTFVGAVESQAAAAWLARRRGRFFCVVSIDPPHSPVTIPPFTMLSAETRAELEQAGLHPGSSVRFTPLHPSFHLAYRAAMECMDEALRRVIEAVPAHQRNTTTLIVTSDNGTQLGAVPTGFAHAKSELFWGGTRVPCLVHGPHVKSPGRFARQIADIGDVFATVTDSLGGGDRHKASAPESRSLVPILSDVLPRDDVRAHKPYVVEQLFYPIGATSPDQMLPGTRGRTICDGRFRLVEPFDAHGQAGLFDTRTDPLERADVRAQWPDEFERLRAELDERLPR